MKKMIMVSLNVICLMTIFTKTCYAYLDPATTSYVIQIIAGVVIAFGAAISIFWNKLTRKFRKKDSETDMPSNKASGNDEGNGKVVTADDLLDDE